MGAIFGGEIAVRLNLPHAPAVKPAKLGGDAGGAAFGLFEDAGRVVGAAGDFDADMLPVARTVAVAGVPAVAIERQPLNRLVFVDRQMERRRIAVVVHVVDFVFGRRIVCRIVHANADGFHRVGAFERVFARRTQILAPISRVGVAAGGRFLRCFCRGFRHGHSPFLKLVFRIHVPNA